MATNHGLNFTINPCFTRSGLSLTPPPSLSSNRNSGVDPNIPIPSALTQVGIETQVRINAYRTSASEAYLSADEIGKKLASFNHFIRDLENPNIRNDIFVQSFKQHVGSSLFKKVCEEVAEALTGDRNSETGERLLNENFRAILRIKNYDGQSLLDQIASFYAYQLENYRGMGELNHLGEILEKYHDILQRAGMLPINFGARLLEDAAKLKLDAIKAFQNLPNSAKGAICKRIYELDGGGEKERDYGYNQVIGDIQKLFSHQGVCPIKDAILTCTGNATRSPAFLVSYLHNEEIQSEDSKATVQEIRKLYQLEDLKHFLQDSYKNNDFLVEKYRNLDPEISLLINKSIWLACYQPLELGFSEKTVSKHVRFLLDIKNQQGADIISQLIAHQQEKIKGLRLVGQTESFIMNSSNKSPSQVLELFNRLDEKIKNDLRERVWRRDGGEQNPEICGWREFFGRWGLYGTRKIEAEPNTLFLGGVILASLSSLKAKIGQADSDLLHDLEMGKAFPEGPIDVSSSRLEKEPDLINNLPPNLKVAFVTAEFAGVASLGGLGSAVEGMARGFSPKNSRVIMPLYKGGPIPNHILQSLKPKPGYDVVVDGRKHKVFKATVNGIKCYFIEDPELFWIHPKYDGTAGNFYEGDPLTVKRRWAVFQSAASELVYKMSKKENPVQLVHVHDSQTALVPKFLAARHPDEWRRGETPATIFTFHNNQEPSVYEDDQSVEILKRHGLFQKVNSFIEALQDADVTTTVSETFAKEAQTSVFGNRMHHSVKRAAMEGRLFGIVNGNSNGWNPAKDVQLQNWKSVQGMKKGQTVDLRFGPNSPDLADKIKTSQLELSAYLKSLPYDDPAFADLDPEKPIVTYIGRYDWSQKGIDKLFLTMEETLKNGGQFVCVGVEPDHQARAMLDKMKQYAREHGKKGVLILEDNKENGCFKYQGVFGSLLRAATSLPIFPSIYEPCGLVQGEFNRFGKKVIATRTGGFADTLRTEGPDANGYLFKRCNVWYSAEQDKEIVDTLKKALAEAREMQQALYYGDPSSQKPYIDSMRTIMRNALNSSWEKTPDGSLSPIRRLDLAMAKAFELRKRRGQLIANLKTLKA